MKIKDALMIVKESSEYQEFVDVFCSVGSKHGCTEQDLQDIQRTYNKVAQKVESALKPLLEEVAICCKSKKRPGMWNVSVLKRAEEFRAAIERRKKEILPELCHMQRIIKEVQREEEK